MSIQSELLSVIVLDDDVDTRFAIGRILSKCGCDVVEADTVEKTLELLSEQPTQVIFSDVRIPGAAGGVELLEQVRQSYADVHVVLMSCAMDQKLRSELTAKGAAACLQKPFFKDDCLPLVEHFQNPLQKSA